MVYHWGTVPNTEIHKTECWCTVTNQKTWLKLPVVQQCQAILESKYTFLKGFVVFGWFFFFCLVAKPTLFTLPSTLHDSQKDDILKQQVLYYVLCVSSPEYQLILFLQNASPECSSRECFWTFLFFIFSLWNSCRTSTLPLLIDLTALTLAAGDSSSESSTMLESLSKWIPHFSSIFAFLSAVTFSQLLLKCNHHCYCQGALFKVQDTDKLFQSGDLHLRMNMISMLIHIFHFPQFLQPTFSPRLWAAEHNCLWTLPLSVESCDCMSKEFRGRN